MRWYLAVLVLCPITALAQSLVTAKTTLDRESSDSVKIEEARRIASALRTVVPITNLRIHGLYATINFGSGFCLEPECRFIVTNYHVAKAMGKHFSIHHDDVVHWWLASGPNDEGATTEGFNPLHDLAILELQRSLSRKGFHGLQYNTEDPDELTIGQEVNIYSFPLELNPKRKLQYFHGHYLGINQDGLLAFSYEPNPLHVRGGASGGLIVDSSGRAMAVLADVNPNNMVLGVPINVLSSFVSKIQPYLAARIFPHSIFVPPVEPDFYPRWVRPHTDGRWERRPVEPPDVQLLRVRAQDVVDTMRSLVSVESFEWGHDAAASDPAAIGYYQVRTFDGYQHFQEYPDGKKEMSEVPWPKDMTDVISPGNAWSSAPKLVAKQYNLRIRRVPDVVWKGQSLRVFQYVGAKEDDVCEFDNQTDYLIFVHHDIESYDCFGEAWTDQDENLIRISDNYHMPNSRSDLRLIVTFGWANIAGERLRVPVTLWMQVVDKSHVDWCRGQFTNYQHYRATVGLLSPPATK
ncbi:MAG TPA: serine protease [Terriglobales bacterium]|nr:serine protease [Terriglobales bacterium]